MVAMIGGMRRGRVSRFDAQVGLGEITIESGEVIPFQCIEIVDGTRTIDEGAAVAFETIAKLGRYEAAHIRPA